MLTLGFMPIVGLWVLWVTWRHTPERSLWRRLRPFCLLTSAFLLLLLPWSLYASRAYGGPVAVDTTGAYNLALGARTAFDGGRSDEPTRNFVLALLDPGGFGRAEPQLAVDIPTIDFGAQPAGEVTLTITNSGRRYVEATLDLPTWLDADRLAIELAPGRQIAITLAVKPRGAWARGRRGAVRVHLGNDFQQRYPGIHKPLVAVPVRAPASLWRSLFGRALHQASKVMDRVAER